MNIEWIDTRFAGAAVTAMAHSLWIGVLILLILRAVITGGFLKGETQRYFAWVSGLFLLLFLTAGIFLFQLSGSDEGSFSADHWKTTLAFNALAQNDIKTSSQLNWRQLISFLWLLGICIQLLRFGIAGAGLLNLKRNAMEAPSPWKEKLNKWKENLGINRNIVLLVTPDKGVPFIFGVFRPVIVFPAVYFNQLSAEQIESILIHELIHIRRHDFLINIFQMIIESLLYFNPAVWIINKQIRRSREFCCDDQVQDRLHDNRTYLEALYQVAKLQLIGSGRSVALFNEKGELILRVKRMLNLHSNRPNMKTFIPLFISAFIALSFYSFTLIDYGKQEKESTIQLPEITVHSTTGSVKRFVTIGMEKAFQENSDLKSRIDPLNQKSKENNLAHRERISRSAIPDTTPDQRRSRELEIQLEQKQEELEKLSEEFENTMELGVEEDIQRIEELAAKLEAMHVSRMDEFELKMEDHPDMVRLEELTEKLEENLERLEKRLENSNNEGKIRELQEKIEMKAKELSLADSLSPQKRLELENYIHDLQLDLEVSLSRMKSLNEKIMKDESIRELQKEILKLQESFQPLREKETSIWSEEMEALQKQIIEMQRSIHEKMAPAQERFRKDLEMKMQEMREIRRELEQEKERMREAEKGK